MRSTSASSSAAPRGRALSLLPRIATTATVMLVLASAVPDVAAAQDTRFPEPTSRMRLAGPRFGATILGGSLTDSLRAYGVDVAPVITQFGWQWERIFYGAPTGPVVVSEWVLLVGGLEQGAFLPSLSWLIGMRTPNGTEFGVGPNLGPSGFALALAGGVTQRLGTMNLPLNVAVVPSKSGARVSFLAGITMR